MNMDESLEPSIAVEIVPMEISLVESVSEMVSSVINALEYYNDCAREKEIEKYSPTKLLERIKNDPDSVVIAKVSNELAGFCISQYEDGLIWLSWLGVQEPFRKRGIGKKLLYALENSVLRRGSHKIWCDSRINNVSSQSLLQKAGYRKITTLSNHWYGQDFFLWEKYPS